jgi:hypothetical protein
VGDWFSHKTWLGNCGSGADYKIIRIWIQFKVEPADSDAWESPKYLA